MNPCSRATCPRRRSNTLRWLTTTVCILITQAIERALEEVAAAFQAVYGEERSDVWLRSRAENMEVNAHAEYKKDLLRLLPDIK